MAGNNWRRRLSNLFLLSSALILEGVALFGVRSVLAARQLDFVAWRRGQQRGQEGDGHQGGGGPTGAAVGGGRRHGVTIGPRCERSVMGP